MLDGEFGDAIVALWWWLDLKDVDNEYLHLRVMCSIERIITKVRSKNLRQGMGHNGLNTKIEFEVYKCVRLLHASTSLFS